MSGTFNGPYNMLGRVKITNPLSLIFAFQPSEFTQAATHNSQDQWNQTKQTDLITETNAPDDYQASVKSEFSGITTTINSESSGGTPTTTTVPTYITRQRKCGCLSTQVKIELFLCQVFY